MLERRRIVDLWTGAKSGTGGATGEPEVLVTLVRTEGSSYRRPGARLLLARGGIYAGTISGGCLEAEVVRKAIWAVREGAVVNRYSTLFDDTAEIPFGLGCGGVVDLLLEPAGTPECHALIAALEASLTGTEARVVTWLPGDGRPLRRAVLSPTGDVLFATPGLPEKKLTCARTLQTGAQTGAQTEAQTGAQTEAQTGTQITGRFVEHLRSPQRLFVIGAGDDARPLVTLAGMLGWRVTVADGRAQLAARARFPEAEAIVITRDPANLGIGSADAVVLMTHSYEQDRAWLTAVLPLAPRYLGLLGARHRSSLLLTEAARALGWPTEACSAAVHAPMGLDLGGDGPEAIALSTLAEIQACIGGRDAGQSRRLSPAEIRLSLEQGGGADRYLDRHCALTVGSPA